MTERAAGQREVAGNVKWFDVAKGFGFVVTEEGGRDILLHANVLRNFGQNSVVDGAAIRIVVQETQRGIQAVEVLEIRSPERSESTPHADMPEINPEAVANAPLLAARVKWFDRAKGFGFANAFGQAEDIFIHAEVLRRSGLAELMAGEAISVRVVNGKRGLMAGEVGPWDAALKAQK